MDKDKEELELVNRIVSKHFNNMLDEIKNLDLEPNYFVTSLTSTSVRLISRTTELIVANKSDADKITREIFNSALDTMLGEPNEKT